MSGTARVSFTGFRESLVKGKDYKEINEFPDSIVIDVPRDGITNNQLLISTEQLTKINNAWMLVQKEAEVSKNRALAHQGAAEALIAEINASSAFKQVEVATTNWKAADFDVAAAHANYEIREANAQIAEFQRDVAQSSVPLKKAEALVQLETVKEQFYIAAGELLKVRTDRGVRQQVLEMQGYAVGQLPQTTLSELPIPEFQFPQFSEITDEIIGA